MIAYTQNIINILKIYYTINLEKILLESYFTSEVPNSQQCYNCIHRCLISCIKILVYKLIEISNYKKYKTKNIKKILKVYTFII